MLAIFVRPEDGAQNNGNGFNGQRQQQAHDAQKDDEDNVHASDIIDKHDCIAA